MNALRFDQRKAEANLILARSCDPADDQRLVSYRDEVLAWAIDGERGLWS